MMNRNYRRTGGPPRGIFFLLIAAVVVGILGGAVMLLWNAVLPSIAPVAKIDYARAVGLLVLCRILFGSFRPSGRWRGGGSPWRQKWAGMSEEERLRFREEWKKRCAERKGE